MKKFSDIIETIRQLKKLKSEAQVAELFGFTRSGLSSHKQRNTYPFQELIDFCMNEDISFDWLVLGRVDRDDDLENCLVAKKYLEKRVFELTQKLRECDPDFEEKEPEIEYFPKKHK